MSLQSVSPVTCLGLVHAFASAGRVAGPAGAKASAGWFQWRGPNRDGKSPDTGLLKRWPEGGPTSLWKVVGVGQG